MSYYQFVLAQRHNNPCLLGLADFLSDPDSDQRDCRILKLDFPSESKSPSPTFQQIDIDDVQKTIYSPHPKGSGRILIFEDLCREVIEVLGTAYNIDPVFFASHLHAPFRQIVAQTPNLAILPSRARKQNFVNFHYHRTVELQGKIENEHMLTRDANVSRKIAVLAPTEGTRIALVQHACSVILFKESETSGGWLCIILVDTPIHADHILVQYDNGIEEHKGLPRRRECRIKSKLFLDGYEDFLPPSPPATMDNKRSAAVFSRESLLVDLMYYWKQKTPDCFDPSQPSLLALSYYPLKILAAEWINYMAAMSYHIKRHENAVEKIQGPGTGLEKLHEDLRSLQLWRRRSLASQQKIAAVKRFVTLHRSKPLESPDSAFEDASGLLDDYEYLDKTLDDYSLRLGNMLPVVTSLVQISDSRRSLAESTNVSRLTSLAFVFIPLTFTTGLFSMNTVNGPGGAYFWVFFAVAIPITLLVSVVARPPTRFLRWLYVHFRPSFKAAHYPV